MKFQLVLTLSIFVTFIDCSDDQFRKETNCLSISNHINGTSLEGEKCVIIASWMRTINDECMISEYLKETITTSNSFSFSPNNGVANCTMKSCDSTEIKQTDCETAFGTMLMNI